MTLLTARPLVIFHSPCPDGFTAAWCAARAFVLKGQDVELYPTTYGNEPPYELAHGREVYVLDFSYPREQMEKLYKAAGEGGWAEFHGVHPLICLDHHKTAQAALEGLPYCTFDMERSGAGLAWDFFFPAEPRPWLVNVVEDRDLWRFAIPGSDVLSLLVRATPYTLEAWDQLHDTSLASIAGEAAGCKRYLDHYVESALLQSYVADIDCAGTTHSIACANVCYTGRSDVNHGLLRKHGTNFAISWHVLADGRIDCGIAAAPGQDCSRIAKFFGGGGHAGASGFRLALAHHVAQSLIRAGR